MLERGQAVRHLFLVQACGGSNPPAPAIIEYKLHSKICSFFVYIFLIIIVVKFMLYIASSSVSRKNLLQQALIPFQVIAQHANESQVSTDQPLHQIVMQIAQLKMNHAEIPPGMYHKQICFVLTADTLGLTQAGRVLTKPCDRDDAITMLTQARAGTLTATGFCIRTLEWDGSAWNMVQEVVGYDQAQTVFDVPDDCIDWYLDTIPFLSVSGAISIEGFGGQFLQSVNGNYETIVGLPMFKIRKALHALGFYEKRS